METPDHWPQSPRAAAPLRVDCTGLNAGEVLLRILPSCVEAKRNGTTPFIIVSNLERLEDSVTRLLKAFDRLAEDFDARIKMSDSSGFGAAFVNALAGAAHVELRDDRE